MGPSAPPPAVKMDFDIVCFHIERAVASFYQVSLLCSSCVAPWVLSVVPSFSQTGYRVYPQLSVKFLVRIYGSLFRPFGDQCIGSAISLLVISTRPLVLVLGVCLFALLQGCLSAVYCVLCTVYYVLCTMCVWQNKDSLCRIASAIWERPPALLCVLSIRYILNY